jgi:hypothetical protein
MSATATAKPKEPQSTKFKDRFGREWDLELTLGSARRVDASDYSLLTDRQIVILRPDKTIFGELLVNTPLLCAIAWTIVKPSADRLACPDCATGKDAGCYPCEMCGSTGRFTENSFVDGLTATAIADLRRALWESLCRFFPDQRTALSICLRQYENGLEIASQGMEEIEEEIGKQLADELRAELATMPAKLRSRVDELHRARNQTSGESVSG